MELDSDLLIQRHAATCQKLVDAMKHNLGRDYFTKGQDVEFELTPKGRSVVHYDGLLFYFAEDSGDLRAARAKGGRAEYGTVDRDGPHFDALVGLGDPQNN